LIFATLIVWAIYFAPNPNIALTCPAICVDALAACLSIVFALRFGRL